MPKDKYRGRKNINRTQQQPKDSSNQSSGGAHSSASEGKSENRMDDQINNDRNDTPSPPRRSRKILPQTGLNKATVSSEESDQDEVDAQSDGYSRESGDDEAFPVPTSVSGRMYDVPQIEKGNDTETQYINKLLIACKQTWVGGPPIRGLADVIIATIINYEIPLTDPAWNLDERNLMFAQVRSCGFEIAVEQNIDRSASLFNAKSGNTFNMISQLDNATAMLTDVFESHMATAVSKAKNDPEATKRYHETKAAYERAKDKQNNMGTFDLPLTPGELRLIDSWESKAKASMQGPVNAQYQNQNANCYFSKLVDIGLRWFHDDLGSRSSWNPDECALELITVFAWVHHKLHESSQKAMRRCSNAPDFRLSQRSVKGFWCQLLNSDLVAKDSLSTRDTANNLYTVPRLLRMSSMITGMESVWGISIHFSKDVWTNLVALFEFEKLLNNTRAPVSHSILWYLVLDKSEIMNPLTDDQDQNAERLIAQLVDRLDDARPTRHRPNATPFRKNLVASRVLPRHTS